jgi:antitoxin (DNA-binding transcriptional repressor) of toxin-antitoxin stability system
MKTMSISDFKAHICAELKSVSAGEGVIVLDHNHPVAQVLPYQPRLKSGVRPPIRVFEPKRYARLIEGDCLVPLLEDRNSR